MRALYWLMLAVPLAVICTRLSPPAAAQAPTSRMHRKACDSGDARGCAALGFRYAKGEGVTQDVKQAVALYRKSCDLGSARGCFILGMMYTNATTARRYFNKACDMGSKEACDRL